MRKQLLLIEPRTDIRSLLRASLGAEDVDILECADAATGEILARSCRPDAVVLDRFMPGPIDGMELCRRIKADPSLWRTRVLMLGGDQFEEIVIDLAEGADEYLPESCAPEHVQQQLSAWLEDVPETILDISL
ncbi:response regulator transcription factor [Pelomonas sp. BJYL3]|uniref:response regulator transcription factor n=1 Tax=Pelomonas sp. BJYL3 TaxID=2976697 RepID=UPI0022B48E50|nr:response regulator [Pelomonas sp. BJYL3]